MQQHFRDPSVFATLPGFPVLTMEDFNKGNSGVPDGVDAALLGHLVAVYKQHCRYCVKSFQAQLVIIYLVMT